MAELTVEKIIEIHDYLIDHSTDFHGNAGGEKGVRDRGTIEYVLYRLNKKNNIFKRAALALHMIATRHPFVDGNKRTALGVANYVLTKEGYRIDANQEPTSAVLKIAKNECGIEETEKWVKKVSQKINL